MVCVHKLILPFEKECKALSVTFGDSSPKGRAKKGEPRLLPLPLGEVAERSEDGEGMDEEGKKK